MISIKNLSKTFNKNIHAVRNVDLEIEEAIKQVKKIAKFRLDEIINE